MTDKKVVLIHNCMDLQDIQVHGSCSETWLTSQDANEIISIKVEDVSKVDGVLHLEKEVDVKLRFSGIKTEHEVSCLSVFHC
jgi:hypothetical protein